MILRILQKWLSTAVILAVSAGWYAHSLAATDNARARLSGIALYRERIALTRDAAFEARLEAVSRADAPAEVIGRVRWENPGQVPIAFEIPYDPDRIDSRERYVVRASVYEGGRLRFTGTQTLPVVTPGNKVAIWLRAASPGDEPRERRRPQLDVLGNLPATFGGLLPCADCLGMRYEINLLPGGAYMQRVTHLRENRDESFYELGSWSLSSDGRSLALDAGGQTPARWAIEDSRTLRKLDREGNPTSERPCDLTRQARVESMEPRVKLTGMFRYMADAARFRDCRSGLQWPVAMSDGYQALERAYNWRRGAPDAELLVTLNGRIEPRPRMEGDGEEPTLVVERFLRAMPGESCDQGEPRGGLANTRWRPIRIGDQVVVVSDPKREPWIVLDPRSKRASGSGGCNQFSGGYEADDEMLRFDRLTSTMMACPSMGTETAFFRALGQTRRYRVRGRMLELSDDSGRLLVRLEERNLR